MNLPPYLPNLITQLNQTMSSTPTLDTTTPSTSSTLATLTDGITTTLTDVLPNLARNITTAVTNGVTSIRSGSSNLAENFFNNVFQFLSYQFNGDSRQRLAAIIITTVAAALCGVAALCMYFSWSRDSWSREKNRNRATNDIELATPSSPSDNEQEPMLAKKRNINPLK